MRKRQKKERESEERKRKKRRRRWSVEQKCRGAFLCAHRKERGSTQEILQKKKKGEERRGNGEKEM